MLVYYDIIPIKEMKVVNHHVRKNKDLKLVNLGIGYLNAASRSWIAREFNGASTNPMSDYKNAIDCFNKALKINPNNAGALCYCGKAHYSLGTEYDNNSYFHTAIDLCTKALSVPNIEGDIASECKSVISNSKGMLK